MRLAIVVFALALIACSAPQQYTLTTPTLTPAVVATAWANADTQPGYVSKETMGEAWPLSIDKGILACTDKREVILITVSGIYAVNDIALEQMEVYNWKDIYEVTLPGVVDPLLDVGLALCK